MLKGMKAVSVVITKNRADANQPTKFFCAEKHEWVSVVNKTDFNKHNLKWDLDKVNEYLLKFPEFVKTINLEISVDFRN